MKWLKKIYATLPWLPARALPKSLRVKLDAERYSIDQFVWNFVVPNINSTDLLLDAGAGFGRYRKELSKAQYVATDFNQIFHKESAQNLDFVCSLDDIPKPDNTYDVIVNTQVLEHVEFPDRVIKELYRVLKPGGKLFLTTNQTWMVHGAPHNYYFFTKYGLESLFKQAGFEISFINARGGVFWTLGKFFNILPAYLFYQLCYEGFKQTAFKQPKLLHPVRAILLYPFYLIAQIVIATILPLIFFYLDRFDRQKDFTLGYACYCIKK